MATNGDNHTGGEDFDHVLVDHCIGEFKRQTGIDLEENVRAKGRLKKEAEKVKILLSNAV